MAELTVDCGEGPERVSTPGAGCQRLNEGLERRPRTLEVAGFDPGLGSGNRPVGPPWICVTGQRNRALQELRRGKGGAAGPREIRCVLEFRGRFGVRSFSSECEM